CFGGLWTKSAYERELASPNSELLTLTKRSSTPSCSEVDKPDSTEPCSTITVALLGLGCLWSIGSEAHITLLAIHPYHQRQGFGQALLHALLVVAWQRGLEQATLEVRTSNQPALSLYQRFGFQEAGRRRRYYVDTGEDGLILWRSGLQHPTFGQTLANWQVQIEARLVQNGWKLRRSLLSGT
ncbi:MAG TPA: ribosomal protein S18-alanine N-acetyltransferase, partial [Candidatus Caenarcaniphilales bacterium]